MCTDSRTMLVYLHCTSFGFVFAFVLKQQLAGVLWSCVMPTMLFTS